MARGMAEDVSGPSQLDRQFQNDQVRLGVYQTSAMTDCMFQERGLLVCRSKAPIGTHKVSKQRIKLVLFLNTGENALRL